ncbi:MAG TPA: hypothetical protein VHX14_11080 [Thermoanaerobaculia bacterium]|nr:hypothetical protein [Thermoanaerobaculia bacterium]
MVYHIEMESKIQANAELVRTVAKEQLGVDVGYDEAGVRWLDGYIARQHESASDELKNQLVNTLGSFLGECIRQTYGGQWATDPQSGAWCIQFSPRNNAYPFNKVRKQLFEGADDSVLPFFTAIAALFPAAAQTPAAKPWWKVW